MKVPYTIEPDYQFDEPITPSDRIMDLFYWACVVLVATVTRVVIALPLGYFVAGYQQQAREARCINSACSAECKNNGRFTRHVGCKK